MLTHFKKESLPFSLLCDREKKKKGGKADEKKRKSGGEKERDKVGNESFKSKEFISSEESSSDSDHGKGRKRKVTHCRSPENFLKFRNRKYYFIFLPHRLTKTTRMRTRNRLPLHRQAQRRSPALTEVTHERWGSENATRHSG